MTYIIWRMLGRNRSRSGASFEKSECDALLLSLDLGDYPFPEPVSVGWWDKAKLWWGGRSERVLYSDESLSDYVKRKISDEFVVGRARFKDGEETTLQLGGLYASFWVGEGLLLGENRVLGDVLDEQIFYGSDLSFKVEDVQPNYLEEEGFGRVTHYHELCLEYDPTVKIPEQDLFKRSEEDDLWSKVRGDNEFVRAFRHHLSVYDPWVVKVKNEQDLLRRLKKMNND